MDADRWQQIQDIYLDAADLPPGEREAFLTDACRGDADLRTEVESLLAAEETGDPLLESSLDDLVLLMEEPAGSPQSDPQRAGPYRILEEIGRGGMGTVYRAERADDQYTREVALKLVRLDVSHTDAALRFRQERQILAGLEHANIARLYDAGVTEAGQPYLAMELVRGQSIHTYCDSRSLAIPARLALFEQVCRAVEFAHRNLVIHRDLKPSNILVTEQGEVKLLDFGIAKLMESESDDDDEPLTGLDQRLLTPEYASPEQVKGEGLTTASDVYSLGVVLHQLLTGRRPEGGGDSATTTPSTLVRRETASDKTDSPNPEGIARARGTTPARLQRLLRGELDTIALKALRPETDQRYPTAAALLDDLVRYRSGRAITARPPTLTYRAGKFVRRNRVAVAAAGIAVTSLIAGLGIALNQTRVARQERDVAQSVSSFLENMFDASNPFSQGGERLDTLRISAFLEQAVDRLDTDLADQPLVQARMQLVLGSVHENLGVYDRARELLEAALASYRDLEGPESPQVSVALSNLGRVVSSAGDATAAEPYYREALAIAVARHGDRSRQAAQVRTEFAGVLLTLDRLAEAEEVLAAAVDVRRREFGEVSSEMGDNLNLLGGLRYRQGKVDEAIFTMSEALDMNREALGPGHPNTAIITQNLGFLMHRQRRYEEAEALLREAIRSISAALGPDYPNLAATIKTLANVLDATGQWTEADSLYRESIAFTQRVLGDVNQDMVIALHDYGGALAKHGQHDRAIELLREALGIEEQLTSRTSPGYGVTLGTLASATRMSGDPAAAERMYAEVLETLGAVFPPAHPRVLGARSGLGLTLADLGRTEEAEQLLLAVYEQAGGLEDGGVELRTVAGHLAGFYEEQGDADEAARWREIAEAGG